MPGMYSVTPGDGLAGREKGSSWMDENQTIYRLPSKSCLEAWLASLILVKLSDQLYYL